MRMIKTSPKDIQRVKSLLIQYKRTPVCVPAEMYVAQKYSSIFNHTISREEAVLMIVEAEFCS